MTHPNQELLSSAYDEFIKGGIGAVINQLDDGIRWHIGGRNRFSREWNGKYGVNEFFRELMDFTLGTFELEVHDVLASDEHGVVMVRERARRNGRVHDMNTLHVWTVRDRWSERGGRDGALLEFWRYPEDAYADDEFFS